MAATISLGKVSVVVDREPPTAPPPASSREIGPSRRTVSLADAVRTSGFGLLQPGSLPAEYQLARIDQIVAPPPSSQVLFAQFVYNHAQGNGRWLTIKQEPNARVQQIGTPFDVQEVKVAGRSAAYFFMNLPTGDQPGNTVRSLVMFLEVGNLIVTLVGGNLALEDAVQIAASLR